jgi:hypothetical protein
MATHGLTYFFIFTYRINLSTKRDVNGYSICNPIVFYYKGMDTECGTIRAVSTPPVQKVSNMDTFPLGSTLPYPKAKVSKLLTFRILSFNRPPEQWNNPDYLKMKRDWIL